MSEVSLNIIVVLLLILLNGLFAMAELAIVSSRRVRLRQMAIAGSKGAQTALNLVDAPNRFLSTVQVGITLIGIFAGAFGGATIAEPVATLLVDVPLIGPYREAASLVLVLGLFPSSPSFLASWFLSESPCKTPNVSRLSSPGRCRRCPCWPRRPSAY